MFPGSEQRRALESNCGGDEQGELVSLRIEIEAMHKIAIASLQMSRQLAAGLMTFADCYETRKQLLAQLSHIDQLVTHLTIKAALRGALFKSDTENE